MRPWAALLVAVALAPVPVALAQEPPPPAGGPQGEVPASLVPRLHFALEGEANFRSSQSAKFVVPYKFDPIELPIGQTSGFESVVNPGQHFEFSNLSLLADATWSSAITGHARINFINLYYRNPTSSGDKVDVVEGWLRFGREADPATLPQQPGLFLKRGKFAQAERQ
ncbi:MAG TPA: hypothetical protein VGE98_11045, partial [Thermoanaerobaculia bacterium]